MSRFLQVGTRSQSHPLSELFCFSSALADNQQGYGGVVDTGRSLGVVASGESCLWQ